MRLEQLLAESIAPLKILIPVTVLKHINSLLSSIRKGIKAYCVTAVALEGILQLFETVVGVTDDISKSDPEDEFAYDISDIKVDFETAAPYLKSFLDDKSNTSDFKQFYNLVAVSLHKLIHLTERNLPNVKLMNILALQALSLDTFLKSIKSTFEIRHHYEHLDNLVLKAWNALSTKKQQYEKIVRAQIDRTYPSMVSDLIRRRLTYYDKVKKVRLVSKETKDSKIGMEERHKILKEYIDKVYVPKRLAESIGAVDHFLEHSR